MRRNGDEETSQISDCDPVKFAPHCTGQGLRNSEMLKAKGSRLKVRSKSVTSDLIFKSKRANLSLCLICF